MKVYKITLMVVDHNNQDQSLEDLIRDTTELSIVETECKEITKTEYLDGLNYVERQKEELDKLFSSDYNRAIEEAAERVRGCSYMDAYSQENLARDIEDLKR